MPQVKRYVIPQCYHYRYGYIGHAYSATSSRFFNDKQFGNRRIVWLMPYEMKLRLLTQR